MVLIISASRLILKGIVPRFFKRKGVTGGAEGPMPIAELSRIQSNDFAEIVRSAYERFSQLDGVDRFPRLLVAGLLLAAAGAEACNECAGAADESEDDGGIFGRVVAAGLGAQRKGCGEDESEGQG
jgi:hypothetical protein